MQASSVFINMSGYSQQSNKDRSSNFCNEETKKPMLLLQDYPKMATEKYERRQTGERPAPSPPSETTERLNSIMGQSISGPAVYDSDALDTVLADEVPDDHNTKAKINLNFDEDCMPKTSLAEADKDMVSCMSEDPLKENVLNNIGLSKLNEFDSSTPKSILRKPVSKERSFKKSKRKTAFTPLEMRKRIILHAEKKLDFLSSKQQREIKLSQYAKEEHEQNMRHKQELHEQEVKMNDLILEKLKYEAETAKKIFNKT